MSVSSKFSGIQQQFVRFECMFGLGMCKYFNLIYILEETITYGDVVR